MVELMVAIAVLAIILVAAGQILATTASLTTTNNKHLDANDQARMVFDCMADDFARMVRRRDVDYLFWKNTPSTTTGTNDTMYFYTEGASYFDLNTFTLVSGYAYQELEKNSVSLVGYRVNNTGTLGVASYSQLERLGRALSWDGQAYNASQSSLNSKQPFVEAFLTYPPAGTDVQATTTPDTAIAYSTAYFNSTIAGAFSNNSSLGRTLNPATPTANKTPTVGTEAKAFNDGTDTTYHTVGSQVFRFEYAFQLKDGTMSDKPIMTPTSGNGLPASNMTATQRPLPANGLPTYVVGSRWWDTTNHIGYICLDSTPSFAVWHEIGIQDIAAIVVTIAVIDKQGLILLNSRGGDLSKVAAKLPDYTAGTNPAYLLDPSQSTGWAYALLPGHAVSTLTGANKLPQTSISQIRIYQRYFYLNAY